MSWANTSCTWDTFGTSGAFFVPGKCIARKRDTLGQMIMSCSLDSILSQANASCTNKAPLYHIRCSWISKNIIISHDNRMLLMKAWIVMDECELYLPSLVEPHDIVGQRFILALSIKVGLMSLVGYTSDWWYGGTRRYCRKRGRRGEQGRREEMGEDGRRRKARR